VHEARVGTKFEHLLPLNNYKTETLEAVNDFERKDKQFKDIFKQAIDHVLSGGKAESWNLLLPKGPLGRNSGCRACTDQGEGCGKVPFADESDMVKYQSAEPARGEGWIEGIDTKL
jgi:hypothetical protein